MKSMTGFGRAKLEKNDRIYRHIVIHTNFTYRVSQDGKQVAYASCNISDIQS